MRTFVINTADGAIPCSVFAGRSTNVTSWAMLLLVSVAFLTNHIGFGVYHILLVNLVFVLGKAQSFRSDLALCSANYPADQYEVKWILSVKTKKHALDEWVYILERPDPVI